LEKSQLEKASMKRVQIVAAGVCGLCVLTAAGVFAQQGTQAPAPAGRGQRPGPVEDNRPPLFLRETWKEPANGASEIPVTQEYVLSPNLEMKLYGAGGKEVNVVHHASPKDEPTYIWSGLTTSSWAVTVRDKNNYADLSSPVAKIKWRTKMAGFHLLRPVIKLADGTMLVGDHTEAYSTDWHESEFSLADVRWRGLDPEHAVEASDGRWRPSPDLSKVDEIGFTDLSAGTGHGTGGFARVDYIEVYGFPVKR
jgi:hypothetical protein